MTANTTVQLLADFVGGEGSMNDTILHMKSSHDHQLFSSILGHRYTHGIDVKRDLGGYVQSEGQAYSYSNSYDKHQDHIEQQWREYLGLEDNLALFKTPTMRERLRRYNKMHRVYQRDYFQQQRPKLFRQSQYALPAMDAANPVLDDQALIEQIIGLIKNHKLENDERRKIIAVSEDFIFTPKRGDHCGKSCPPGCSCRRIHWAGVFELNRIVNFARFLFVFAEISIEASLMAAQAAIAPTMTVTALFPNAAWLLQFANHVGFTQLGFSIYIMQILILTMEYAQICRDFYLELRKTGMDKAPAVFHAMLDAAKNFWLKPAKASAFINAAVWMSLSLIATFGFPAMGGFIFMIGFWFDVLHGLFWLARALFQDHRHARSRRMEELWRIYQEQKKLTGEIDKKFKAKHQAEFDQWYYKLKKAVDEQDGNTLDDYPESAVRVMKDLKKIRQAWWAGIKDEIIGTIIGVTLAACFTAAVYATPLGAGIASGILFLAMVAFVVIKYHGFVTNRKRERDRLKTEEEVPVEALKEETSTDHEEAANLLRNNLLPTTKKRPSESSDFREVREDFKQEKKDHRYCFFNKCKHKQANYERLVEEQEPHVVIAV